jgi:hypothetical protein
VLDLAGIGASFGALLFALCASLWGLVGFIRSGERRTTWRIGVAVFAAAAAICWLLAELTRQQQRTYRELADLVAVALVFIAPVTAIVLTVRAREK